MAFSCASQNRSFEQPMFEVSYINLSYHPHLSFFLLLQNTSTIPKTASKRCYVRRRWKSKGPKEKGSRCSGLLLKSNNSALPCSEGDIFILGCFTSWIVRSLKTHRLFQNEVGEGMCVRKKALKPGTFRQCMLCFCALQIIHMGIS
jgi:hypothetical protein